jgi:YHS domain-containing protein
MRRRSLVGRVSAALLLALPPVADEAVFTEAAGTAIDGYNTVAYHPEGRAVRGAAEHALRWRGVTCRFTSAAHRELFAREPERYAQAFGGFCAYVAGLGECRGVDPEVWDIVDDALYLFAAPSSLRQRRLDPAGNLFMAGTFRSDAEAE